MMDTPKKIGLIGGVVVVMALLVWLFSADVKEEIDPSKKFVSSKWDTQFELVGKDPRGLYLFTKMVSSHIGQSQKIKRLNQKHQLDSLFIKDVKPKLFMFVGNDFGLETEELDTLLGHVEKGSTLFLSFRNLTENIHFSLLGEMKIGFHYDAKVKVTTSSISYQIVNLYQNDTVACDWNVFENSNVDPKAESVSSIGANSNFLKIPYGKGWLLLQSTPAAFYNYQLKRDQGFFHARSVLEQLPKKHNVYFLELGRLSEKYGSYEDEEITGKRDDSYFQLIFEHPALLAALLLAIFSVILFVVFRSKRSRPVVPYLEKNRNMTVAFAETITSIYYSKHNPYQFLQVQRANFYATVHKHFFIDMQRREGEKELLALSEKSNVGIDEIRQLISDLETQKAGEIADDYLADMLTRMRRFYREAGIVTERLDRRIEAREVQFQRSIGVPASLIFTGVFLLWLGIYFLMKSTGVGAVFIPLGFFLTILGSLLLGKPYFIVRMNKLVYFPPFGKQKVFDLTTLRVVDETKSGVVLTFSDGKKLQVDYWKLSKFNTAQFKTIIHKLNTSRYDDRRK